MGALYNRQHRIELPWGRGVVEALEYSDDAQLCKQPILSVSMLTYAHEAYLPKAIESVLSQKTNFEFELIIGEDCSPDKTLEIALRYQEEYPQIIRVISGEKNVGARRNNHRCGRLCRGKYIAFCEGDDYWHDPEKLQMQVNYLEGHPLCGLVYTNADTYHILSGQRMQMAIPYRPELCDVDDPYLQQLTGARIIWPLTVCVPKDLRDEITRDCPEVTDDHFLMGDTPRYLEIARRAEIHYMPISTATRNLLPESTTQSQSIDRKARFIASNAELILHYLEKYPVPDCYDCQIRRWVHLRELYYAYECQDSAKARRSFTALKEKQIPVPLRHRLYYHGALDPAMHVLVKGFFHVMDAAVVARNTLSLLFRASEGR